MTTDPKNFIQKNFHFLLFFVFAILLFTNLDNIYLWQDEADTALKSRSIATDMVPKYTDGTHFFKVSEPWYQLPDNLLPNYEAWGQYYVAFAGLKIFGETTFAARFLFTLFGFFSAVYFYYFCRRFFQSRRTAIIALILFVFSVPLILHFRQCRYYAPTVFFAIASLDAYSRLLQNRRGAVFYFITVNVLLFNFHYGAAVSFLAGFMLHWIFSFGWRKEWRNFFVALGVTCLADLPMVIWIYTRIWQKGVGDLYSFAIRPLEVLETYILHYINNSVAPLVLLGFAAALGVVWHIQKKQEFKGFSLFVWIILAHLGVLTASGYYPFFRNLLPVIPLFFIIVTRLIDLIWMKSKWIAVPILVVMLTTNAFAFPVNYLHRCDWTSGINPKIQSALGKYLYEITHNYDGPVEAIVKYLNANAETGDTLIANNSELPILFYTNLNVKGGVGEIGIMDQDQYRKLGIKVVEKPEWVIIRKAWPIHPRYYEIIQKNRYQQIVLDAADLPWENRPSPDEHFYETVQQGPRVKIFKLIR